MQLVTQTFQKEGLEGEIKWTVSRRRWWTLHLWLRTLHQNSCCRTYPSGSSKTLQESSAPNHLVCIQLYHGVVYQHTEMRCIEQGSCPTPLIQAWQVIQENPRWKMAHMGTSICALSLHTSGGDGSVIMMCCAKFCMNEQASIAQSPASTIRGYKFPGWCQQGPTSVEMFFSNLDCRDQPTPTQAEQLLATVASATPWSWSCCTIAVANPFVTPSSISRMSELVCHSYPF